MDEYLDTDHSVILTQQGEEGGECKNKQCSCSTKKKKRTKVFMRTSARVVFMWNDSGPPLLSYRDAKGSKTPKTHFFKNFKNSSERCDPVGSRLRSLLSLWMRRPEPAASIYSQSRPPMAATEAELRQFISMLLCLAAFCLSLLYLM